MWCLFIPVCWWIPVVKRSAFLELAVVTWCLLASVIQLKNTIIQQYCNQYQHYLIHWTVCALSEYTQHFSFSSLSEDVALCETMSLSSDILRHAILDLHFYIVSPTRCLQISLFYCMFNSLYCTTGHFCKLAHYKCPFIIIIMIIMIIIIISIIIIIIISCIDLFAVVVSSTFMLS